MPIVVQVITTPTYAITTPVMTPAMRLLRSKSMSTLLVIGLFIYTYEMVEF